MANIRKKDNKSEDNKHIHDRHRQRMRERVARTGFKGFSNHEVLEFMLYYALPRVNTNTHAHDLINFSGSLVGVLRDSCVDKRLNAVRGIGDNTIIYLKSLKEFVEYYRTEEISFKRHHLSRENFRDIMYSIGMMDEVEHLKMICLDRNMYIKNVIDLTGESDSHSATVKIDKVLRYAASSDAKNVVLVHNHPSGCAEISREDYLMTERIDDLLKALNIFLVDHYIITNEKTVSVKMSF